MAVSKDRVLFKEHGVLVTYERFIEPEGKEYRIEDILAVDMEVVEEESDRPPIRWWRTVGGGGVIGIAVAAVGGFAGAWLTMGIFVGAGGGGGHLVGQSHSIQQVQGLSRDRDPADPAGGPPGASDHLINQPLLQRAAQGCAGAGQGGAARALRKPLTGRSNSGD